MFPTFSQMLFFSAESSEVLCNQRWHWFLRNDLVNILIQVCELIKKCDIHIIVEKLLRLVGLGLEIYYHSLPFANYKV